MVLGIHHSNSKCEDCGIRHNPGDKETCILLLKEIVSVLKEEADGNYIRGYKDALKGDDPEVWDEEW